MDAGNPEMLLQPISRHYKFLPSPRESTSSTACSCAISRADCFLETPQRNCAAPIMLVQTRDSPTLRMRCATRRWGLRTRSKATLVSRGYRIRVQPDWEVDLKLKESPVDGSQGR
jgi:hypothetical protein